MPRRLKKSLNVSCRTVLALLYIFFVIFVIYDVVANTNNYYNLVSLSGIVFYVLLMYIFSTAPNRVSIQYEAYIHHITSHGKYRSRPPKASVSEK